MTPSKVRNGSKKNTRSLPRDSNGNNSGTTAIARTKRKSDPRTRNEHDVGPLVGSTVVTGTEATAPNPAAIKKASGKHSQKGKANAAKGKTNARGDLRPKNGAGNDPSTKKNPSKNGGVTVIKEGKISNKVSDRKKPSDMKKRVPSNARADNNSKQGPTRDNNAAPTDDKNEEDEDSFNLYDEDAGSQRRRIIPKDRVHGLTEAQLNEKIVTLVEAEDTQIPTIMHNFNLKTGESKQLPPSSTEHLAIHLSDPDFLTFVGKQKAPVVDESSGIRQEASSRSAEANDDEEKKMIEAPQLDSSSEVRSSSVFSVSTMGNTTTKGKKKDISNQFSFDDRTTQTHFSVLRQEHLNVTSTEIQTDDLPNCEYTKTISPAINYEFYVRKYYTNKEISRESVGSSSPLKASLKEHSGPPSSSAANVQSSTHDEVAKIQRHHAILESDGMEQSLCIMERMINRNQDPVKYDDYCNWGEPQEIGMSGHEANNHANEDGGFFGNQGQAFEAIDENKKEGDGELAGDLSADPSDEKLSLPLWEPNMFQHDYPSAQYALHSKKGQAAVKAKKASAAVSGNSHILNKTHDQDVQQQIERPPVPHSFRNKCLQVTALCWNARFPDLYAVGFGSQDFLHRDGITPDDFNGAVCCYSLKNSFHPEYRLETNSAVTCLDFYSVGGNNCRFENENTNPFSSFIVVGCFDGTVLIYDYLGPKVNHKSRALFRSTVLTGRHQSAVWQISWERPPSLVNKAGALSSTGAEASPDAGGGEGTGTSADSLLQVKPHGSNKGVGCGSSLEKYPRFFSISGDGQVALWTIRQSALCMTVIVKLSYLLKHKGFSAVPPGLLEALDDTGVDQAKRVTTIQGDESKRIMLVDGYDNDEDDAAQQQRHFSVFGSRYENNDPDPDVQESFASGACFDFHPMKTDLFLVGTEAGSLHLCSQNFKGQYLETYEGHAMRVSNVQWNFYHENLFLSCSEDKTVKLWNLSSVTPVKIFDSFKQPVSDVSWSPHSSTIFAAVTGRRGMIHMFDLSKKKDAPVAEQKVRKKNPLTQVRFSPFKHVLLVGGASGIEGTFKLHPDLRAPTFVLSMLDEPNTAERDSRIWALQNKQLNEAVYGTEATGS